MRKMELVNELENEVFGIQRHSNECVRKFRKSRLHADHAKYRVAKNHLQTLNIKSKVLLLAN